MLSIKTNQSSKGGFPCLLDLLYRPGRKRDLEKISLSQRNQFLNWSQLTACGLQGTRSPAPPTVVPCLAVLNPPRSSSSSRTSLASSPGGRSLAPWSLAPRGPARVARPLAPASLSPCSRQRLSGSSRLLSTPNRAGWSHLRPHSRPTHEVAPSPVLLRVTVPFLATWAPLRWADLAPHASG